MSMSSSRKPIGPSTKSEPIPSTNVPFTAGSDSYGNPATSPVSGPRS